MHKSMATSKASNNRSSKNESSSKPSTALEELIRMKNDLEKSREN